MTGRPPGGLLRSRAQRYGIDASLSASPRSRAAPGAAVTNSPSPATCATSAARAPCSASPRSPPASSRAGSTERLPRLADRDRALEVLLSSQDYDADTAERWGWISGLPHDELDGVVDEPAARLASFDKPARHQLRQLLRLPRPARFPGTHRPLRRSRRRRTRNGPGRATRRRTNRRGATVGASGGRRHAAARSGPARCRETECRSAQETTDGRLSDAVDVTVVCRFLARIFGDFDQRIPLVVFAHLAASPDTSK